MLVMLAPLPLVVYASNVFGTYASGSALMRQTLMLQQIGIRRQLKGINLAGNDGYIGKDSRATLRGLTYYLSHGMNVYRLMERWETLQPDLDGPLSEVEVAGLDVVVNEITSAGAYAIIDAHQGGRRKIGGDKGKLYIIGQDEEVTAAEFADFWTKLAHHYEANPNVILNLQNEPHDQDSEKLVANYNKIISDIRAAGVSNMLLIDGNTFTGGGQNFFEPYDGSVPNAIELLKVNDPMHNMIVDIHQYFDGKNGGTKQFCDLGVGGSALTRLTEWARHNQKTLFLGEFGFGSNKVCFHEVRKILSSIEEKSDVWLGWAYFGAYAGAEPYNTPDTFWYNIDPLDFGTGKDDPRMAVLREFLP